MMDFSHLFGNRFVSDPFRDNPYLRAQARPTELWGGASGRKYLFSVYPLEHRSVLSLAPPQIPPEVPEWPGVYILTRPDWDTTWQALYIGESGEADGVRGRLVGHEQLNPALNTEATHVHVHLMPFSDKGQRMWVESDLKEQHISRISPLLLRALLP